MKEEAQKIKEVCSLQKKVRTIFKEYQNLKLNFH